MNIDSAFLELDPAPRRVTVRFDGRDHVLPEGGNLAAGLLVAGVTALRDTPVRGRPRGAFCMMGACQDCLVMVDGVVVRACMTEAVEGMIVARVPPHG